MLIRDFFAKRHVTNSQTHAAPDRNTFTSIFHSPSYIFLTALPSLSSIHFHTPKKLNLLSSVSKTVFHNSGYYTDIHLLKLNLMFFSLMIQTDCFFLAALLLKLFFQSTRRIVSGLIYANIFQPLTQNLVLSFLLFLYFV